jgi:cytochrome c-type biogenesis protein
MTLLIVSFVAGVLTVAAPCILPLLPVIIGGTIAQDTGKQTAAIQWQRPLVIALSLAASVVVFTLLLKATTTFLGVPQMVWNTISGVIVLLFGLNLLFPIWWERLMVVTKLNLGTNSLLSASYRQKGINRDILMGAALGPVFSSCSPTYALIVAVILPASFATGLAYLIAYAIGLASILLLIGIAGQSLVAKLGWLSNPKNSLHKVIGVLFILVGIAVIFGWDRDFQSYVLEQGWYDPIMKLEESLQLPR